jgi:hypothetical protein
MDMPGYFDDGTVQVELGEHAFATPAPERRNVILEAHDRPAEVLDSGGGMMGVQVTGQRLRANLGDAERYIYELLVSLALAEPGDLGLEDSQGNRSTFGEAVCVGAAGEVQAFRFAEAQMEFLSPEKATEPAWGAVPAAPATYGGTDTLQDYSAGGVQIGTHPVGMRIEMLRSHPLREVPRARGARTRGPAFGAHVRFIVTSHAVTTGQHLAAYLEGLSRQIGPRPVDLTANGNTYSGVILEALRPDHTDGRHTRFVAEFVREIAPAPLTTTPAPYATTTSSVAPTTTAAPTTTSVAPTTTTSGPTTTTTAPSTTTTTPGPPGPNEGLLDAGALQSGGAAKNEGVLDSGPLQT